MGRITALAVALVVATIPVGATGAAAPAAWLEEVASIAPAGKAQPEPTLTLVRQDHEKLQFGRSVIVTPLHIGEQTFAHGLGTHSVSQIRITAPGPLERLTAHIGVDNNPRTQGGQGSVRFGVSAEGKDVYRSPVVRGGQAPLPISVDLHGAMTIELSVDDAGDGPACDHANWAEARIVTAAGRTFLLDELPEQAAPTGGRYPFSFLYDGQPSARLLDGWRHEHQTGMRADARTREIHHWDDPDTHLRVTAEITTSADFPAREWLLRFENTGAQDSGLIEDVQALDLRFRSPLEGTKPYLLTHTKGGPAHAADFEVGTIPLGPEQPQVLSAGQGRSSHATFPFFKLQTRRGSAIIAVGWSGMWEAAFRCPDTRSVHVQAGQQLTRFRLHPGESVRSPRILVLMHEGDTFEASALFRQLIYSHYAARRSGETPLPTLFCNTCFTRGGGWLNECNAQNQISLINAYAPLGLQALLTDAGWFEGGWPAGAGNWTPRRDAYPEGMGPVAAAAKARGMIYGLWFEPERVVADTELHKKHPDWLLASTEAPQDTYLVNFGLPAVRDHFFNVVKGFMDLPGFRFYRQDFNMDPLPYWRFREPPDRQGITEMKYIEGLYAYWDRIAQAWPDSLREECASGGNRIDLETVCRMHLHQKTDYWFDNEVDQASLYGLSQYLPNNVVVAHLNRMNDYSFHSTFASSLCLGWIADASGFDAARGKALLEQYLKIRHLLVGAWYPLLPYSRDQREWSAAQYHRPDLDEGLLLVFRRADCPYRSIDIVLRGLKPDTRYAYDCFDPVGKRVTVTATGAELMRSVTLTLPDRHQSDLIVYRAVK